MMPKYSRLVISASSLIFGMAACIGVSSAAEPVLQRKGTASFYSDKFQGRKTASGERFDQRKPTAASNTLPLGSKAKVTNLETGKTTEVEITDRGPKGRTVDLSKEAAAQVGLDRKEGVAPVKVEAKPSEQPDAKTREAVAAKAGRKTGSR